MQINPGFKPKQNKPSIRPASSVQRPAPLAKPLADMGDETTENLPSGETMSEGDTSGVVGDPLMDYAMSLDDSEKARLVEILTEQLAGGGEIEGEVDLESMAKEMSPEDEEVV
jgi:hypothetical protein